MDERTGHDLKGDAPAAPQFRAPGTPKRTARTVAPESSRAAGFTGEQRLLLLDAWMRSKLAATEFAELVGVTATTLHAWRRRFEEQGPAGLLGHRRSTTGRRWCMNPLARARS